MKWATLCCSNRWFDLLIASCEKQQHIYDYERRMLNFFKNLDKWISKTELKQAYQSLKEDLLDLFQSDEGSSDPRNCLMSLHGLKEKSRTNPLLRSYRRNIKNDYCPVFDLPSAIMPISLICTRWLLSYFDFTPVNQNQVEPVPPGIPVMCL